MDGCTFAPELSEGTIEAATKRTKGKESEGGIFHALHEQHVELSQKKAYYEQIAEINEECTFKPEINKTSEVLNLLGNMEEGTAEIVSRPKYEELYAERNKRAEKVEQVSSRQGGRGVVIWRGQAEFLTPSVVADQELPSHYGRGRVHL